MSFLPVIDKLIEDLNSEFRKVHMLREDKKYHVDNITEKINRQIREGAKLYPHDPVKSLGAALQKVPEAISESFDYLNVIESNLKAAFNAYSNVRDLYVEHVNIEQTNTEYLSEDSENKDESDVSLTKEEITDAVSSLVNALGEEQNSTSREIRKVGIRPEHKLRERDLLLKG